MRKFLVKISLYSIIILALSFALQFIVDNGLQNYNYGNYAEWNEIFKGRINPDIIVLGSSRALVQYDSKIIENYTRLSCYNFGTSGGRFVMQNAKWELYLSHNKPPRILIQDLDIIMLLKEDYIFGKAQFLPYLSHQAVSSNLEEIDKNIWLEKIIPLYKYRGLRHTFILGLKSFMGLEKKTKSRYYKGFIGTNKEWNQDFKKFKLTHKYLTFPWHSLQFGFDYLENLIIECKKKNINLIFVQAPMYYGLHEMIPQKDTVDSIFSKMAASNNIPFWDYSKDSLCYNKKYLYNSSHLNLSGAEIFSRELGNRLNSYNRNYLN